MRILSARTIPYLLPFPKAVQTARGAFTHRRGVLLSITDQAGRVGYGDAAAWPGFGNSPAEVAAALDRLCTAGGELLERELDAPGDLERWHRENALPSEAAFAVDTAVLDLIGQQDERSLAQLLSESPYTRVASHALVSDEKTAMAATGRGFTTLKIKVGGRPLREEITRVAEIRRVVGDQAQLRLDANGAWDCETACRMAERLEMFDPQWLEQPVAPGNVAQMAEVRAASSLPVAADESIQQVGDVTLLADHHAIDAVVIKPMYCGGLLASLEVAAAARERGLPVCVTHAMESAVGRRAALHLAAALGETAGVCGLGDPFELDVAPGNGNGPWLQVPPHPGLGLRPSSQPPGVLQEVRT